MKKRFVFLICCCCFMQITTAQEISIDGLQIDLARQISLAKQAQELSLLLESLARLPDDVIDSLMDGSKSNTQRLKDALKIFHDRNSGQTSENNDRLTTVREHRPTPKLTAKNIVYAQVSSSKTPGMVIFLYEGNTYSSQQGKGFSIRGKKYLLVSVNYKTTKSIEVAVKTDWGTTKLLYSI